MHGKQVHSIADYSHRLTAFTDNHQLVAEHNSSKNRQGIELGDTVFADLTPDQFTSQIIRGSTRLKSKHQVGPTSKPAKPAESPPETGELPSHKNWYEDGYVNQPGEQGSCGACWAFATASLLESAALIEGRDLTLQKYSVQQLIDCDTKSSNTGCSGGWIFEALEYTQRSGIALASDYPHYSHR